MRSGRKSLTEGRRTGYGRSPAWSRRWGAGLAAASCCLLMLAVLDGNLSGLMMSSAPRREVSSFNLSTLSPMASSEPPARPREIERPPASPAGKAVIGEQAIGKATSRPTPLSLPVPVPPTVWPLPSSSSQAKPLPEQSDVVPVQAPDDKKASALAAYQSQIWARIAARKPVGLNLSGVAMVRFVVGRDGELVSVELSSSSGNTALDRLALRTVRNASPFAAPPMNVERDQLIFTIPFSFH